MFKLDKLALAFAFLVSGSVIAATNDNDIYMGTGFGQSYLTSDNNNGTGALDDRDLALQGVLGYGITNHFAIEASYVDLGNLDIADLGYNVSSLQALIYLPSNGDSFSIYGKLGGSYVDVDTTNTDIDAGYDVDFSGALGVRWNMNENWFARAEYNYYNTDLQATFLQIAYAWGGGGEEPVTEPVMDEEAVPVMLVSDFKL